MVTVESTFGRTIRPAEVTVAAAVTRIYDLGLRIASEKIEALWFYCLPPWRPPARSWVRVGGASVEVKYLGLILDSHWSVEVHFDHLVPRVERTEAALGYLLPILDGLGTPTIYGSGAVHSLVRGSHMGPSQDGQPETEGYKDHP
ncbi:uncharacterized protein LOC116426332 [Nomia melanderi]|uniref:uncharacterized protein LOC116426332 n=1 Tax=Nomia melanderi TaxID=2448451 RepID=UPI001304148E|nr:uncharacterized protein LOC116426332 [Nomia melanderi]